MTNLQNLMGTGLKSLLATENLLENTDGDGSLLRSIYADGGSSDRAELY